jgi:hypothetical protein
VLLAEEANKAIRQQLAHEKMAMVVLEVAVSSENKMKTLLKGISQCSGSNAATVGFRVAVKGNKCKLSVVAYHGVI